MGKKFETTDGFPTIPVQKSVETMARIVRGKKFETTMDLQQSKLKKVLKLLLDLKEEKSLKQRWIPKITVQKKC